MRLFGSPTLIFVAFAMFTAGIVPLQAANVKHMTLPELVANADRIVRGTVLAADATSVPVAGGSLPATIYRIRIAETLKGSVAPGEVIEVRLLASPKGARTGAFVRGTLLQDLPRFDVGREYLFLLTRPSAIGLSTTVGLTQGLFELRGRDSEQTAVNGANNLGLFEAPGAAARVPGARAAAARPGGGPIPYSTLAGEIRALVAR